MNAETLAIPDPSYCSLCAASPPHSEVATKDGYRYVQCSACGVVRQHPYPSAAETSAYYGRYQSKKSSASTYLTDAGYSLFVRDKRFTFGDLEIATGAFTGKRVCDVGCATGQFLQMMADEGAHDVFGIDIGEEGIQIARQRGLNCVQGNFLDVRETFDVITMWHLVEHLPDPRSFIQHAYEQLAPGGWFLVETPAYGPIAEAFGSDWRFYMPVEHVNLFPPESLVRVCRDAGFRLERSVTFGSGNTSGVVPPINKRAMDSVAKRLGIGDVVAAWFVK